MERSPIAVESVKNLQASGKRWLEDLLGQQLQENQQVFIMVFTPRVPPTDEARARARLGLEETWAHVEKHMRNHRVTDEEFDAAVDEAMEEGRHREP